MEQSSIDILAHRNPWMAELEVLATNSIIMPEYLWIHRNPFTMPISRYSCMDGTLIHFIDTSKAQTGSLRYLVAAIPRRTHGVMLSRDGEKAGIL